MIIFAYFGGGHEPKEGGKHGSKWVTDKDSYSFEQFGNGFWFMKPDKEKVNIRNSVDTMHLSYDQPWCKWHIAIRTPFYIGFSFNFGRVPKFSEPITNQRVFRFNVGI